ncbi:MAG: hypothetical protein ACOC2H_02225 [Spirochaetota bacterium]
MEHIRIWKEVDIKEIDSHLLIIDDLHGHCNVCKRTGIKLDAADACPECKTRFKYIASRVQPSSPNGKSIYNKLFSLHGDKLVIDYDDYKHLSDKKKAANLFKDI